MPEEQDLQAKIAALEARISNQRQAPTARAMPPPPPKFYHPPVPGRYAPYNRGHYVPPRAAVHRNRSLVVNHGTSTSNTPGEQADAKAAPTTGTPTNAGWVQTRDRGAMAIINTTVFDQKAQDKKQAMEETAEARRRERNEREKSKVIRHFQGRSGNPAAAAPIGTPREIVIGDLRFRVAADGSKLLRVLGESGQGLAPAVATKLRTADGNATAKSTPKTAKVAGVTFHRSKNGNLLRAGLVKTQRYWNQSLRYQEMLDALITLPYRETSRNKKSTKLCPSFTSTGTHPSTTERLRNRRRDIPRPLLVRGPHKQLLTNYLGTCAHGDRCRDLHDINKLAICKDYLRHGKCDAGEEACNLSHDSTPNRVPACVHFQRAACTKDDCRYAHVRVNPSAPVCRNFALVGYCDKGVACAERHVSECPDYANTGICRNIKCRLPHVDHAGNLRKAAAKANKGSDDSSDMSSDEEDYQEIDSDDVDSTNDDEDMVMFNTGEEGYEMSEQRDFISFS